MKKNLLISILLLAVFTAFAQKLPFQGKLIENGVAVDSTLSFEFSIPSLEWSETHGDVVITDGLYFVVLGSINPLPDSLFYGTDEQSLDISVDGTALSPVVLFKPLATPYEGSELNVRNSEGTVVGSMKARTDSVKHGELKIMGENTGIFEAGFYKANDDLETDIPFISLEKDSTTLSYMSALKWNDNLNGRIYLGSTGGDYANIYPNQFNGRHNGRSLFHIGHADWSNTGNFGLLLLDGPNSGNFELTGQHWGNPDLPFLKMKGSENQSTLTLSVENNPDESGTISLNTKRDENLIYRELNINSTGLQIREKENWNVLHEAVSINAENRDDNGWAGYLNLSGPSSGNIHLGTRHWENANLPVVNLNGDNDFHGLELSVLPDDQGNQYGFINLWSENGKHLNLSPEGLGVNGVGMSTTTNNAGTFGSLTLNGPNTDNFQFMPSWWDQPDLPRLLLLGTSQIAAIDMGAYPENGIEKAEINLHSTDGSSSNWSPKRFSMRGDSGEERILSGIENNDYGVEVGRIWTHSANEQLSVTEPTRVGLVDVSGGGWNPLVMMDINNNTGNGWAGNINVSGPNSNNFEMGTDGGNPDYPFFALRGENNIDLVHIAGGPDPNNDIGYIQLFSEDGNTNHVNGYGMYIDSNPTLSSSFDSYQLKFVNDGREISISADGVTGNVPLDVQNGLNVMGDVVVNGVTEHSSDKRFKKNIQSIGSTLQKIELMEGVSYDWRQDEFPEKNFSSDKQIGLIAQDLEAQFPALVKTDKEGYKSVNYNGFTAVLLEAVKELNAKVEKLEAENNHLKAELSSVSTNSSELGILKEQMEVLSKLVQEQHTASEVDAENITTVPGLK